MKPHLYFAAGSWWVTRDGRAYPRQGIPRASFREACQLAILAAIHAGLWKA